MNVLVTGGAGFIGSHIVDALLTDERIASVRVLDNLSTGFRRNIKQHFNNPRFEFIEADIRDFHSCRRACLNCDVVLHQAALGSIPRSITNPITTNDVNINGMLNVIVAGQEVGVKRIVYAASSSTYGDNTDLPKLESRIGKPLSPYAVTKLVNELYADVFSKLYGIEFVGLRYFNVFGPRQNPNGAYAAVIPLFIQKMMAGQAPTINGDGENSRDFTFVGNVVHANMKALFCTRPEALNQVYNVAFGNATSLNNLFKTIAELTEFNGTPNYGERRQGDILHSLADISKAQTLLDYDPSVPMRNGLEQTVAWFKEWVE